MRKIFLLTILLVADPAHSQVGQRFSDPTDAMMAEKYGTCTRYTCPPGTTVKVDVTEDDTDIATTSEGGVYDLLNLKGMKLLIVKEHETQSANAIVQAPGGQEYFIQWIFLKKI
ncbi:hypothetical protein CQW29_18350 [Pantoea coffeiphila]|uniref:Adhesin n=1 Tax=Pantoea coffeiphila TaxID=1465635 RepID=A0A2S9I841_9GAMM|nr:hypothetical protein CQW29_18350 [Pantoea coffeiphila]